ncbi:DUF1761 family protein [Bacillus salacetis]|uniref:DUF1761 family protein n=2 Tax=Bacillus salacetis TaxID=2315464 RepID=A0A3A1QRX4_9BACI|nr:DUF1761 family protein [Bacillus salacetis]
MGILIGGIVYVVYGAVYYSFTVGKKKSEGDGQSTGPAKYILSVILAFISSFFVGVFVHSLDAAGLIGGGAIGLAIGMLVTLLYLKNSLFGLISKKSFSIAAGDHLVIFTLLGILHGFFQ